MSHSIYTGTFGLNLTRPWKLFFRRSGRLLSRDAPGARGMVVIAAESVAV